MNNSNPVKEPPWINDWRRDFKKAIPRKKGYEVNLDLDKHDNPPFDYLLAKKIIEAEALKGNISDSVAKQLLEELKKRDGTVIGEAPPYEKPAEYYFLKKWAEKMETAIPRFIKLEDDSKKQTSFNLIHPACIITARMGELNAASGRIKQNPNPGDIYHYIALDTLFFYFVIRVGELSARLFDPNDVKELKDMKNLPEINLERDPDIYKYFRDLFFHFIFYGNKTIGDENIRKFFVKEFLINHTGFLPPPDINMRLFFGVQEIITDSIGLFIMGHEYSHIMLHDMFGNDEIFTNEISESYQKEFQADALALKLTWDCILHEHNYTNYDRAMARFCFIGVEIALNCLYLYERMRGVLGGNKDSIIDNSHPPTERRMKCIRESINLLWKGLNVDSDYVEILNGVDCFFQKLGDKFVDELLKNEYVLKYRQSKREKIDGLVKEASELCKKRDTGYIKQDSIAGDKKIIDLCENILLEDANNITALSILGTIDLARGKYKDSVKRFMKIINITSEDFSNDRPFDQRLYMAMFNVGFIYTQQIEEIITKSNYNPNPDQEKLINKYLDEALALFIAASYHYHENGMAYYYIGAIYSQKNEPQKALENLDKALQYQPDNEKILFLRQTLMGMQSSRSTDIDSIIKAANSGDLDTLVKAVNSSNVVDIIELTNAAKKGDPEAQMFLGISYENGLGIPVDLEKAIYWFKEAAGNGLAEAQNILGSYYETGKVVKQDFREAIILFTKAAEQGHVYAQYELGSLYCRGIEGVHNLKESLYWFTKAAEQGFAKAQHNVGVFHENGYGLPVPEDPYGAIHWYTKAAEQGLCEAQYNLGLLWHKLGNIFSAITWLKKAAEQGDQKAKEMLKKI